MIWHLLITLLCHPNLAAAATPDSDLAVIHQFEKESSAQSCRQCHQKQYDQWTKSRHRSAFTNAIFLKGYQYEPSQKCLECHLPTEEQRLVLANDFKSMIPEEGVSCTACHGRSHSGLQDVGSEQTCAKCHQFSFLRSPLKSQQTIDEWQTYRAQGGQKTCIQCHMPQGNHAMAGSHDEAFLQQGLLISFNRKAKHCTVTLENKGAGHNIPTGDIFRHLAIEIQTAQNEKYQQLYLVGRNPFFRSTKTEVSLQWKNDNSLRPGERRDFLVEKKGLKSIRVVFYHEAKWAGAGYSFGPLSHQILGEKKF